MKTSLALAVAVAATKSLAKVCVLDPGDYVDLDAASTLAANAVLANYSITPELYQVQTVEGPYEYAGVTKTIAHETLEYGLNDTSVIVVHESADVTIEDVVVIKSGYGSNLFQESFFGINAAINVANTSTAIIKDSNITVLEGGANVYSYGSGTNVYVYNTDLYSAGPTSHGLYASGNGTAWGYDIRHYSGGNRASSFSGDSPAGYIHVNKAVAHTAGIGSAIFYCLGEIWANDVVGHTEKAPVLFSDGIQQAHMTNVDLTSDFLAGMVIFSSSVREAGAIFTFNESRLTVTAEDQSALWFGNVIATFDLIHSQIDTASGVLVTANRSQVTQAFDYFAGYEENSGILAAEVEINVSGSILEGNLVAMNESKIAWNLMDYSSWTGSGVLVDDEGYLAVSLDKTSNWTLTADITLQNFTDSDTSLSNVFSNGHNIYYTKNSTANAWLKGKTYKLNGGGKLEGCS